MIRTSLCTAALALLLSATSILAAEIPAEGIIASDFTWTATITSMDLNDGKQAQTARNALVITASEPGSVLDKMVAQCLWAGETDTNSGEFKMSGWCTLKDAEGDQIFESIAEGSPSFTAQAKGTGKLLGGTGKFAGISGDYTYTDDYYGELSPGVYGGIGRKTGTYKIVK